jgi:hypothetical protein
MSKPDDTYIARCDCGRVELEARGPIIVHISCYCDDCQLAADRIDALPGGKSGREADGGTPNVLFRRDRVRIVRGAELLEPHRVREGTWAQRLVATCCNAAVTQIHENAWPHRGVKTRLFQGDVPPLEMRIFTRFAPDPGRIPNDVLRHPATPFVMILRILRAMAAVRWAGLRASVGGAER